MLKADLHYHTNLPKNKNKEIKKLAKIKERLELLNLDILASSEHCYKNPYYAFSKLTEIAEKAKTNTIIIPGIEAVSKEGAELIFLFNSSEKLKAAVKTLKTFKWSLEDSHKIKTDFDAIINIPHPFTPGKTGIANIMGEIYFKDFLNIADYVEIHNGSVLDFINSKNKIKKYMQVFTTPLKMNHKILKTYDLKTASHSLDDTNNIGYSIGSDAHFPIDQKTFGSIKSNKKITNLEDAFLFLKQKHKFKLSFSDDFLKNKNIIHKLNKLVVTFDEYLLKKKRKKDKKG